VFCYADDTLVDVTGDGWAETRSRSNETLTSVVRVIGYLGLEVAPHKTKALFCKEASERRHLPDMNVLVSNVPDR